MTRKLMLAALALACVASPTLAAEVVAKGDSAVVLPYGDYVVAIAQAIEPWLVSILTTLVMAGVTRLFPLARLFVTDKVVEGALQKWLDFGLNAVEGAAKGKSLNVEIGSAVLSQAVNRALDRAAVSKQGAILLAKAGGPAEIANKLFRMLHLDETGSEKILQEVLANLRSAGLLKA